MKYLFLIIRHCFPRKRWKELKRYSATKTYASGKTTECIFVEMKDQFGNIELKELP